mmetsp:Transcript_10603/g.37650  ORF Transcript_10603/g.37650 Transcript_10603/m.37650 type:complete len:243 (+) Transcript_10603:19-747(+)
MQKSTKPGPARPARSEGERARGSRSVMLVSAIVSRTAGWLASTRAVASLFAPLSGSRGLAGYKAPMTPPPDADRMGTADLCDVHLPDPVDVTVPRKVQVCEVGYFNDYGGKKRFWGPVSTVRCFENNPWVRSALEEDGKGRVLVVDAGASKRCAVLGDMLAEMGAKNGWSGIIINGCCRDSEDIGKMDIGVKTIGTHPLKSSKRDKGLRDVDVSFAGVTFRPGDYVYADGDGVLVSSEKLEL